MKRAEALSSESLCQQDSQASGDDFGSSCQSPARHGELRDIPGAGEHRMQQPDVMDVPQQSCVCVSVWVEGVCVSRGGWLRTAGNCCFGALLSYSSVIRRVEVKCDRGVTLSLRQGLYRVTE